MKKNKNNICKRKSFSEIRGNRVIRLYPSFHVANNLLKSETLIHHPCTDNMSALLKNISSLEGWTPASSQKKKKYKRTTNTQKETQAVHLDPVAVSALAVMALISQDLHNKPPLLSLLSPCCAYCCGVHESDAGTFPPHLWELTLNCPPLCLQFIMTIRPLWDTRLKLRPMSLEMQPKCLVWCGW